MATTTTTLQVHARMHRAPPQALISILLLASSMLLVSSAEPPPPPSYRFDLIHVDANGNFTREELIQRAASRTCLREATLSVTDASTASSTECSDIIAADAVLSDHEYLMELQIGTPAKSFMAVVDTGSGLTWVNDDLCKKGPSKSFTITTCQDSGPGCKCSKDGHCTFEKKYGTKKVPVKVLMGTDVLTFPKKCKGFLNCILSKKTKVEIQIGCGYCDDDGNCDQVLPRNASGIVGLSRSSIISQWAKLKPKVSKFSYCLSSPLATTNGTKSHLWFGDDSLTLTSGGGATVETTPLVEWNTIVPTIPSESTWATRYYVELCGISIGEFSWDPAVSKTKENQGKLRSKGGKPLMFLDSGLSYSLLEKDVFQELLKLLDANGLRKNTDTSSGEHSDCFKFEDEGVSTNNRPEIVLRFTDGARMSLPWTSYMLDKHDSLFCLAFIKEAKEHLKASGLGNFQQQNMHMLYDPSGNKLSFVRVHDCSKPEADTHVRN